VIVPFSQKISRNSTFSPKIKKKKKPGISPGNVPEQKDPIPLSLGQSLRLFDQISWSGLETGLSGFTLLRIKTQPIQLALGRLRLVLFDYQCRVCTTKTKAI
jgi:hypothetical protein